MWYLPVSKLRTLRNWRNMHKSAACSWRSWANTPWLYGQLEVLEGNEIEGAVIYAFLIWQPRGTGITVPSIKSITTSPKGQIIVPLSLKVLKTLFKKSTAIRCANLQVSTWVIRIAIKLSHSSPIIMYDWAAITIFAAIIVVKPRW